MAGGIGKFAVFAVQRVGLPACPHTQKLGILLQHLLENAIHQPSLRTAGLLYPFKNPGQSSGGIQCRFNFWGLIITAATMSRGPSRPLPASPARSGGCRAHESKAQKPGTPQPVSTIRFWQYLMPSRQRMLFVTTKATVTMEHMKIIMRALNFKCFNIVECSSSPEDFTVYRF